MLDLNDPQSEGGRFLIGRQLGKGGMGVVYEAYDRHREETVALKTLLHADGAAVYRLKREFRALANMAHPNLVSLYELFAEGDRWFFTMELVEGVPFTDHVRPGTSGGLDEARLRPAFAQLAEGVATLHAAGKVHRDLKPSNVLVTPAGRVVVLDLGLARDLGQELTTSRPLVAGTAVYMSPEQAAGDAGTPASDWYSVGAMLFEAVTGAAPFEGPSLAVLSRKQVQDAPRVADVAPDVPYEIAALCDALLARDPAARPDGDAVLGTLGASGVEPGLSREVRERPRLVGRESHIRRLEGTFAVSRRGRMVTVYVHGLSGMGKSTIVEHFLDRLTSEGSAVVLAGRCYDRESVPYKGLDGVIDSLSHYLRRLPQAELESLLPPGMHTVARLFPVLRRIEQIAEEPRGSFEAPDAIELRRRAIACLRELLTRIGARSPLVVHVDDFQWTDADSVTLGVKLLRKLEQLPLLLILSFRSEEVASNPVLRSFLEKAGGRTKRELGVSPLDRQEAAELAASLLAPHGNDVQPFLDIIVQESGGSPFFVEQLARHVNENDTRDAVRASLGEMVQARMTGLPSGALPLIRTLAIAGRPLDFVIAHRAAGLSGSSADARALVGALRVASLIRTSGRKDRIEVYHDRIRSAIAAEVEEDEAVRIHRGLADALIERSPGDPEALFEHYLAAGQVEQAGRQAANAAARAAEALAFDRAATLYRQALEIGSPEAGDLVEWSAALGRALANAGRPGDAAKAFLDAADHASSWEEALRHRRSAAEWLLIGGHNRRGLEVTRALLDEVGIRMPSSPRMVLLSLLFRRVQIRLRGLGFRLREKNEDSTTNLLRMDICWACAIGLTMTDYILAAYFQARYLLLALRTGEAHRVTRALAFEVGFLAARGGPARRRTEEVSRRALALADELGSPREIGMAAVTTGSAACLLGDFRRSARLCERAEQILRTRCTGVQWELTTCHIFLLTSLTYLGETKEVVRRVPDLIASARERGNLFEGVELRTRQNLYWLLEDDPELAEHELTEARNLWAREGFYRQDYNALLAATQIDLYRGEPSVAWARITQGWSALKGSQLLRVQFLRCEARQLRARIAIAAAERGHARKPRLRDAERDARRLAREQMPWSDAFVSLLRAGIAAQKEDTATAADLLAKAVTGFETANMELYAAASRRRLGELLGGDEGKHLYRAGTSFMSEQAVRDPERMTALLAPGLRA